jgi:RNA methyltransferase, TrmH family
MSYERNFQRIESAQNERLKATVRLLASNNSLRQQGLAVAEGLHLAEYLLRGDLHNHPAGSFPGIESVWMPESLLNNPEWLTLSALSDVLEQGQVRCLVLADHLYSKLSKVGSPTGPLILFRPDARAVPLDLNQDVLLVDGVQDPGNVGTLLRNCAAAGIRQVAVSEHAAWVWSDKVLRAGMGAQFSLKFYSEQDLLVALGQQNGKRAPVRVTSLHPKSVDLFDADLLPAGVWVFGSEGQGVSQPWLDRATVHLRIPQSRLIESMNVGSSAAVCLFEQLRQRR